MPLLKRANEQQQSEWLPVPEGLWRWIVGTPEVKLSEKFGNYQVRFPLQLTESEQARLTAEVSPPADDEQKQSWRTSYTTGLSLGYVQRDGQYKSTRLVDFLSACMGSQNGKKLRDWIADGGGPPRGEENGLDAEIHNIEEWLRWWEGLEVYGSIRHEADKQAAGVFWARFAGPMPVGSLPGQKDDDYQALGRGKLRAMLSETSDEVHPSSTDAPPKSERSDGKRGVVAAGPSTGKTREQRYGEIFGSDSTTEDIPF